MELQQVRYFIALCDTLNFTKAAQRCNVSQPALTKAITKLEDELGGPLFCRERGLTHLTNLGLAMQPHLEAIHASSQAVKSEARSFQDLQSAHLRVGVLGTLGPAPLVAFFKAFQADTPGATLTLQTVDAAQLMKHLMEGELDTVILAQQDVPDRCDTLPLYAEPYVVAFPDGHPLAAKDTLTVDDLSGETVYVCPNDPDLRTFDFELPDIHHASAAKNWTQACIVAGLGCGILPAFSPVISGAETRPLIHPGLHRTVILVTVAGRRHAPALTRLLALAKTYDWP